MNEAWRARLKQWSTKILKLTGWGMVIFIFLGITGNTVLPRFNQYLKERKAAKLEQEYEAEKKKIEELYRNDTYGGTMPEETFDMLLDALKQGDIERASSYYDLSVRERARENLNQEFKEKNSLQQSITYFEDVRRGKKKCADTEKSGGCVFEYSYLTKEDIKSPISGTNDFLFIPKGSERTKEASFYKNKYTNVWKITQPY